MRYGSVCSGIEAATAAWHPLGWRPSFFAEIDPFPRAVLQHRWPDIPLHGDFTTIVAGDYEPVDLLVGGTPCQSFSVAGLRGGLADDRGNLALEYLRLAGRLRPRWLVWENVPGVLSSNGGRDFGSILGGLVELGYGFAYRVLDAQYAGVPQRRRRVFVVGYLGDWRPAAAVLFERHSLQGHSAPRRAEGQGTSVCPPLCAGSNRTGGGRSPGTDVDTVESLIAGTVSSKWAKGTGGLAGDECQNLIAHCFDARQSDVIQYGDKTGPLDTDGHTHAIAFQTRGSNLDLGQDVTGTIGSNADRASGSAPMVATSSVRRLTPRECERLQGFTDDYSLVPWRGAMAPDGPRYRALGNSMAVPVMRWIGERIVAVEAILAAEQARAA